MPFRVQVMVIVLAVWGSQPVFSSDSLDLLQEFKDRCEGALGGLDSAELERTVLGTFLLARLRKSGARFGVHAEMGSDEIRIRFPHGHEGEEGEWVSLRDGIPIELKRYELSKENQFVRLAFVDLEGRGRFVLFVFNRGALVSVSAYSVGDGIITAGPVLGMGTHYFAFIEVPAGVVGKDGWPRIATTYGVGGKLLLANEDIWMALFVLSYARRFDPEWRTWGLEDAWDDRSVLPQTESFQN